MTDSDDFEIEEEPFDDDDENSIDNEQKQTQLRATSLPIQNQLASLKTYFNETNKFKLAGNINDPTSEAINVILTQISLNDSVINKLSINAQEEQDAAYNNIKLIDNHDSDLREVSWLILGDAANLVQDAPVVELTEDKLKEKLPKRFQMSGKKDDIVQENENNNIENKNNDN
eukprot:135291_1